MSIFLRPMVALSLSEPDVELLRYASIVAELGPCEVIRFIHVITTDAQAPGASDVEALRQRLEAEVRSHFRAACSRVILDVVVGPRLDRLLELAIRHEHDVILVGHRRARSGRRSLARRLAMMAPCSVWLVPEGSPIRITNLLVPIDFSDHSADAVSIATEIAAARGLTTCLAIHVFFDSSTVRYDEHLNEIRGREEAAFAELIAQTDCHGVVVEPIFEESTHASQAILRVAQRHEADLIVMNTRGRSRAASVLLGSVTSETMSATSVPLLAVKHFGSRLTLLQALMNHRFWQEHSPKMN